MNHLHTFTVAILLAVFLVIIGPVVEMMAGSAEEIQQSTQTTQEEK